MPAALHCSCSQSSDSKAPGSKNPSGITSPDLSLSPKTGIVPLSSNSQASRDGRAASAIPIPSPRLGDALPKVGRLFYVKSPSVDPGDKAGLCLQGLLARFDF